MLAEMINKVKNIFGIHENSQIENIENMKNFEEGSQSVTEKTSHPENKNDHKWAETIYNVQKIF